MVGLTIHIVSVYHTKNTFIWSPENMNPGKIKTFQRKLMFIKQKLKLKFIILRPRQKEENIFPTKSQIWMGESEVKTHQKESYDFESQISLLKSNFNSGPDYKIYEYQPVTPQKCSTYINLVPGNTPAPPLPPRYSKEDTPPMVKRNYRRKQLL